MLFGGVALATLIAGVACLVRGTRIIRVVAVAVPALVVLLFVVAVVRWIAFMS